MRHPDARPPGIRGRSALGRLRSGTWRRASLSGLVGLALASVLLDLGTTGYLLVSPAFVEGNPFLARLAEAHTVYALGYMALFSGTLVLIAAHSLGWLSTVAGVYVVCVNGVLGASNLVLLATERSLLEWIGLDVAVATVLVTPLLGVALGLSWERRRHGLPWREVLPVLVGSFVLGGLSVALA